MAGRTSFETINNLGINIYLLISWSRVLLEKLTGCQLVKNFPRSPWNSKVHSRIRKCPTPVPILSQLDPVHTPTSHTLKIRLNIIFSSAPGFPKWSLFLRSSHQKTVHTSPLPHTRYMLRLSNFFRINPLNHKLNPICYLLALLGAHHFLHVSRIRVKLLTLRRLMSYIYIYIYIYIYMEHPFLMFLDHTKRRSTVGRTPLDE